MIPGPCPVCGSAATAPAAVVPGRFAGRPFTLARCRDCRFAFVADPWTDWPAIYDEAYYRGRGADPSVDYLFELEQPARTVRVYEWRGIVKAVSALRRLDAGTAWLDFGCGNGGLVRWARANGLPSAVGYETGWIADRAREAGIPLLAAAEIEGDESRFDLITAIEVLEHVPDPVDVLKSLQRLLKPGGTLFVTTGNARPHRERLTQWAYVLPEVHVSYFEPETLAMAMTRAGLTPSFPGFVPGFEDIIRFKVLKALRRRERGGVEALVPWTLAARVVDARLGVSAQPMATKPRVAA